MFSKFFIHLKNMFLPLFFQFNEFLRAKMPKDFFKYNIFINWRKLFLYFSMIKLQVKKKHLKDVFQIFHPLENKFLPFFSLMNFFRQKYHQTFQLIINIYYIYIFLFLSILCHNFYSLCIILFLTNHISQLWTEKFLDISQKESYGKESSLNSTSYKITSLRLTIMNS